MIARVVSFEEINGSVRVLALLVEVDIPIKVVVNWHENFTSVNLLIEVLW